MVVELVVIRQSYAMHCGGGGGGVERGGLRQMKGVRLPSLLPSIYMLVGEGAGPLDLI